MIRHIGLLAVAVFVSDAAFGSTKLHAEKVCPTGQANKEKQRAPRPTEFALVFSLGYSADKLPANDADFDKLLKTIKAGGFNVIHGPFTDARLKLCKDNGVKLMVDLLIEPHHVYKNPDQAKDLCMKLRGNADVWGYNIWNDTFGKSGPGRQRDIDNVRLWDPTHPAYCGTYRTNGMTQLKTPDVMGYYDFHWKRGLGQHLPHALAYSKWAGERDAWYYTWLSATSGKAGAGNFNRSLYSANTSIACGLKGILWFLGTDLIDMKTMGWTMLGQDITRVNKEILPLGKELARLGLPTAIYSTGITRTANNDPEPAADKGKLPGALAGHEFPKDFVVQPAEGEFMAGVYQADKATFLYVANHNAYQDQKAALKLPAGNGISIFQRSNGTWRPLAVNDGVVYIPLSAGGGELLRLVKN